MQRKTRRTIILVIVGVIVACFFAVLIVFVIFANLIATPARTDLTAFDCGASLITASFNASSYTRC